MQNQIQSRFIPTQSSVKSYFVKRKALQNKSSKQAKLFFKSIDYQQQDFSSFHKNNSIKTITVEDSIISSKNNINLNKFSTINPNNDKKSNLQFTSLSESQVKNSSNNKNQTPFSRQNSASSLFNPLNRRRQKKKYIFETICDGSYNKSLSKKQIFIDDSQNHNPQNIGFLPQISIKLPTDQINKIMQSRIPKLQLSRNDSKISINDPWHIVQQQIANKFSIQKLNNYRKLWITKQKKRKLINQQNKSIQRNKSLVCNLSILQKSVDKSSQITIKYNNDAKKRKQKCNWEQQLRGRSKKYVTIGQASNIINGLKGNGQNSDLNIQIRPMYLSQKPYIQCQQIYRCHK